LHHHHIKKFIMKKNVLVALVGLFLVSTSLSAQQINTDSLSLVSKISSDQLKLGKLQNMVDQKTRDKVDAATKAQQSADANKTAADRLGDASQDKKLARQADNKAGDARSDAKKARIAASNLDKLNKNIQELQDKIAKNQTELNKYVQPGVTSATAVPMRILPPASDSTLHP
jgi:cell division protein FtsL